jgi:predicted unusual protein kinase regulating ubiquinone biosynthesis (AarF/ABC1/UbiB family)
MSGFSRERVREETARRLSTEVSGLPTSYLGRTRRKAGTLLFSGKLMLNKALRNGAVTSEADLKTVFSIASFLGELKGVAMKMGQVLGYFDADLPAEVCAALSVLHTHAHPMPVEKIRELVRSELGGRARDFIDSLHPEPMAVASIGQVHRAVLPGGQEVAVKVQYPGIEKSIRADFRPAAIGATFASFFYPGAKLGSFVKEARTRFLEECDYRHEARSQQRFHDLYAHHPIIIVPKVHSEYSTAKVLTTTLHEGVHLEDYLAQDPRQEDRDRFGTALFEFYLKSLFKFELYNCDPHPGNYLFRPDGRLVLLDFGCTRQFEPGFVNRLAALTEAVRTNDPGALRRAAVDIGILRPGKTYEPAAVRELIRSLFGPVLKDETSTIQPGLARRKLLKLALPGEFLFLMRVRLGLAAVLTRLGALANWYQLESDYLADRPMRAHGKDVTTFDVILTDPGENEVGLIRAIRAATGLDLKRIKTMVDKAPQPVKQAARREEAQVLYEALQAAGGTVEIKPTT